MMTLVIAANRLPVEIGADGEVAPSPGGLASALSSVAHDGCTWVGWAGAEAGHLEPVVVDGVRLQPVDLSPGEVVRYYGGFSNSVLWPLFHGRLRREEMNRAWWRSYRGVNERFASAIARTAAPDAVVWVHDYHLLLVPKLVRQRRPDVRIGLFLHIPFPNAQLFSMLPWRQEVLAGMLAADLVGFQTEEDVQNFCATAERILDAHVDGDRVTHGLHIAEVGSFPISVDFAHWEALGNAAVDAAAAHRTELGVEAVFLGIDRLDYTKGLTQRFQAFAELLNDGKLDPERCTFVQVAVPSRSDVPAYQDERADVEALVERINATHRRPDGTGPVRYLESSLDEVGLAGWYRAADALVVTSLADGMNLVAKEFVAARGDLDGVVVLSEFAGAALDLDRALIVNPYDIDAIKGALIAALEMGCDERRERVEAMRERVRRNDVQRWAQQYLDRLASTSPTITRRQRFERSARDLYRRVRPAKTKTSVD
jgi:alpha,alpha-trehalose-phosphate synthase [UDP-forming]